MHGDEICEFIAISIANSIIWITIAAPRLLCPQFWVRTHSGVTSIDWSGRYPSILAVGLYDGSISIYDVRDKDATPVMQADHDTGQHTGACLGLAGCRAPPALTRRRIQHR